MKRRFWVIRGHTASKLLVVLWGVFFFVALSHLDLCFRLLGRVGDVFHPILIGLALAYLIDPLARWLEARCLSHRAAVWLAFLFFLIVCGAMLGLGLRRVYSSPDGYESAGEGAYTKTFRFGRKVDKRFFCATADE